MTNDLIPNIVPSEKSSLRFPNRPLVAGLAIAISLSFAGATQTAGRNNLPDVAKPAATGGMTRWNTKLLFPVNGRDRKPDFSPELLYDLPIAAYDPTRIEVTPQAASVVAPTPAPFLRGLYTGAAKTLAQSNGKSRIVWLEVTAYCPCPKCCGPEAAGITASGKPVTYNAGAFVAADPDLFSFGAKLRVPGYHEGQLVEVIDRGGAIKGAKVDVYFPTHEQAEAWGRQWVPVTVEQN